MRTITLCVSWEYWVRILSGDSKNIIRRDFRQRPQSAGKFKNWSLGGNGLTTFRLIEKLDLTNCFSCNSCRCYTFFFPSFLLDYLGHAQVLGGTNNEKMGVAPTVLTHPKGRRIFRRPSHWKSASCWIFAPNDSHTALPYDWEQAAGSVPNTCPN